MAEVVGTAYVRIRALTTSLSKDISKGLEKGVKGSDVNKIGGALGDQFSKSTGDSINKGLGKNFDGLGKKIKANVEKSSDDTSKVYTKKFKQTVEKDLGETLKNSFKKTFKIPGAKRSGTNAGNDWSKGFLSPFKLLSATVGKVLLAALAVPVVLKAGQALIQYAVSLVGQLSYIAQGFVGIGVAGGAAFGAVLFAAGALFAAFKTQSKQLEGFKGVMKKVGESWQKFGLATQKDLLPGLAAALIATKKLIPTFTKFGKKIGTITGDFAKLAGETVTSAEAQDRFDTILTRSADVWKTLLRIVLPMGDIMSRIFRASLPLAQVMVSALERMVGRWRDIVAATDDAGVLTTVLTTWFEKGAKVAGILKNIVSGLGNIVDIGAQTSTPFFDRLSIAAQQFRAFTEGEHGKSVINRVFEDAHRVAEAFNSLMGDILSRLFGEAFEANGTDGIVGFLNWMEDVLVPFVDDKLRKIVDFVKNDMGPSISDMLPELKEFGSTFGKFIKALAEGDTLETTLKLLTVFLQILTKILEIPGFAKFIGLMGTFAIAMKLLAGPAKISVIAFKGLVAILPLLSLGLGILAYGLGTVLASALLLALPIAGIAAAIYLLYRLIKNPGDLWKDFKAGLEVIKEKAGQAWDWIKDKLADAFDWIKEKIGTFVTELPAKFTDLKDKIITKLGELKDAAVEKLGDFVESTVDKIKELPGKARDKLSDLGSKLWGAFTSAASYLAKKIPELIKDVALFFALLPFKIALSMAGLGLKIIGKLISAFLAVGFWLATEGWPTFRDFFSSLGEKIGGLLLGLGKWITDKLGDAFTAVVSWLVVEGPKILQWFKDLPAAIADLLIGLGLKLAEAIGNAFTAVKDFILLEGPGVLQWFKDLPGNVASFLVELPGKLKDAFSSGFTKVVEVLDKFVTETIPDVAARVLLAAVSIGTSIWDGIKSAFDTAGDFVVDLVKNIGGGLIGGLYKFLNGIIDMVNENLKIEIDLPGGGKFKFPGDGKKIIENMKPPEFAHGGIFNKATQGIIGEDGSEVLIPLTNPRRARELFEQSGLAGVLNKGRRSSGTGTTNNIEIIAQGTSASQVLAEFNARMNWELSTRGDR